MSYKVVCLPLHAPSAKKHPLLVVRTIRRLKGDSTGLTEAYGILSTLLKLTLFRVVMETGGKDRRRGQRDNPIVVRTRKGRRQGRRYSRGSGQVYGADASTPLRIAPERWMTWSATVERIGGRAATICHIAWHPHAGVQDKKTGEMHNSDRAHQYALNVKRLKALVEFAVANGWEWVVTGDFNTDERAPVYAMLEALGGIVHSHNICAIVSPMDMDVVTCELSSKISDHVALVGNVA